MRGVKPDPHGKDSPARGAKVTLIGQLLRTSCSFLGLILLARMLSPADFGLMAMVAVIVGLGELLRDLGLSTASIQSQKITSAQRSNLFWANAVLGLVLTLALIGCSPFIAQFYSEPTLSGITAAIASVFLLNGLAAQHRANTNREMRFRTLAVIDTVPPIIGLVAAVSGAALGLGVWSLVCQQLTVAAFGLVLAWTLSPWRPGPPRRGQGMGQFFRFGLPLVGVQMLGYLSRSIDTALMGARFGAVFTGTYDRAFQVVMMPVNQFNAPSTRVALPVLAKAIDQPQRYSRLLERGQSILIHPVAALLSLLCAASPVVIPLVLGEAWISAVPFIQILTVGALAQTAAYPTYWVFLSQGRTGSNLLFSLVSRPIVIVSIVLGSYFGPMGIAGGYSAGLCLIWPLGYYWIRSYSGIRGRTLFLAGLRACLTYAPAAILAWCFGRVLEGFVESMWLNMIGVLVMYTVTAGLCVVLAPSARSSWTTILFQALPRRSGNS